MDLADFGGDAKGPVHLDTPPTMPGTPTEELHDGLTVGELARQISALPPCAIQLSLREAAQMLLSSGQAAGCVVDESGSPVGVITEDDILHSYVQGAPWDTTVGEWLRGGGGVLFDETSGAASPTARVASEQPLHAALPALVSGQRIVPSLGRSSGRSALLVERQGNYAGGVLSALDVVQALAQRASENLMGALAGTVADVMEPIDQAPRLQVGFTMRDLLKELLRSPLRAALVLDEQGHMGGLATAAEDDLLQAALLRHEKLTHALQQAEEQLRVKAPTIEEDVANEDRGTELEALEAELQSRRQRARRQAKVQEERREQLHKELQLQEARGREERWQIREELTEACVQTEVLHSEIAAERQNREAALRRLREEEVHLIAQVNKASEDEAAEVASRSSYWSGSICSDWSEVARARAALEPVDISTPREVSPSPEASQKETPSSLLQELRGSRRGRTRTSLAGYHSPLESSRTSTARLPGQPGTPVGSPHTTSELSGARKMREAARRAMKQRSSVAAFRTLEINKVEGQKDAAGSHRLSVIEEGPGSTVAQALHGARPDGSPLASLGKGLLRALPESECSEEGDPGVALETPETPRSRSGSNPAEKCHGVLEWVLQGDAEKDGLPDLWAGPGLFQVDRGQGGRRVFRLSALFTTTEELSIPLLTISSVREYTQDPLGMVFAIRYKAEKSQRRAALFRAASSESRSAWVSNLCEAIREARSEVSGR